MAINPDNHRYHFGLLAALRLAPAPAAGPTGTAAGPTDLVPDFSALTPEQRERLAAVYAELAAQHPHSAACRRLPLDFLEGEAFAAAAEPYVRRYLLKGIPSLFRDLRPLYRCACNSTTGSLAAGACADSCSSAGIVAAGWCMDVCCSVGTVAAGCCMDVRSSAGTVWRSAMLLGGEQQDRVS